MVDNSNKISQIDYLILLTLEHHVKSMHGRVIVICWGYGVHSIQFTLNVNNFPKFECGATSDTVRVSIKHIVLL